MEWILLLILILALALTNFIVFKLSGKSRKRRIWSGLAVILITPIVFFVSLASISPFDSGGFGTGLFSLLNTSVFFINGILIMIIGVFTRESPKGL
ncbi:MAG: hypothetical protein ACI35R_03770 [Bacillus sp. (in: firmicutes)]